MRRPHVYERSAPRGQRPAYREPNSDPAETARAIAGYLRDLLAKAEATELATLARLLASALDKSERLAARQSGPGPLAAS